MQCKADVQIGIVDLLLRCGGAYPFSEDAIADAITLAARELTKPGETLRVSAPGGSGVDRFTITWAPNYNAEPKHFTKKCSTVTELQAMLGHRVMEVLKAIEDREMILDSE